MMLLLLSISVCLLVAEAGRKSAVLQDCRTERGSLQTFLRSTFFRPFCLRMLQHQALGQRNPLIVCLREYVVRMPLSVVGFKNASICGQAGSCHVLPRAQVAIAATTNAKTMMIVYRQVRWTSDHQ